MGWVYESRTERIRALLGVANRPLSAYELGMITRQGSGSIYSRLRQLEKDGEIVSSWVIPVDGSPKRRYYEIARRQ